MPRIVRFKEVQLRTGLSRSTLYRLIEKGEFPRPFPISSPAIVGFDEDEVSAWIRERIAAARGSAASAQPFSVT